MAVSKLRVVYDLFGISLGVDFALNFILKAENPMASETLLLSLHFVGNLLRTDPRIFGGGQGFMAIGKKHPKINRISTPPTLVERIKFLVVMPNERRRQEIIVESAFDDFR